MTENKTSRLRRRQGSGPTQGAAPSTPDLGAVLDGGKEPQRKFTAMLTEARYEKLRRLAFEQRTSMTALVSQLIDTLDD